MTPLLLLMGFPPNMAVGTDLLYAALTKGSGVFAHQRKMNINWKVTGLLAAGSIPASAITVLFLHTVFTDAGAYESILSSSLGLMLLATSMVILFRKQIQEKAGSRPGFLLSWIHSRRSGITVIMGVALGVLVTLSSVGAGAFGAALLVLLYTKMRPVKIVGTDVAHAVPLTLVAGLGHLWLGNVNFTLLFSLLLGSLPAIWMGSWLSARLPDRIMRPILGSSLFAMGVKFAFF